MIEELSKILSYTFRDESLLQTALTHRSKGGDNNERLEFLGDAIVNAVVGDALYHLHTYATEGELSRWRASLINRDTLAELAKKFDLGKFLILGPGEVRSGGQNRQSILSCTMEAIIGAIYLDAGFDIAKEKIIDWYQPWLNSLSSASNHKDPKTLLQEHLQGKKFPLPVYKVERIEGEAHQQVFMVSCQVEGMSLKSTGKGTSRRRAEQDAASVMLTMLKEQS